MLRRLCFQVFSLALLLSSSLCAFAASDIRTSGRSEITENPFIAYGVNPITHVITGNVIALRTAPGRTDECRFGFAGNVRDLHHVSVKYLSEFASYEARGSIGTATIINNSKELSLVIKKDLLAGGCEWILPFIVGPRVAESKDKVFIALSGVVAGDWVGVFSIGSVKARFHGRPDKSVVQDAFLVQGDLIYVYEERPDWYYVKYEGRKKTTAGWIRKSDTVQINFK